MKLLTAVVTAAVVFLAGCATLEETAAWREARTKQARAWCDKMGVRVTGVNCASNGYGDPICAVAHEGGSPFRLYCPERGDCSLPEPPSK